MSGTAGLAGAMRRAESDFDQARPGDRTAVMIGLFWLWFALLSGFVPFIFKHFADPSAKPYEPVTHLHAALSFGWLALLSWQAMRVRAGNMAAHRATGRRFGPPLVAAITLTAIATVWAADRARAALEPGFDFARVAFQLGHVVPFAVLTGAALALTHRPGAHKRLLFIGMAAILDTGFSRWLGSSVRDLVGDGAAAEMLGRFPMTWGLLAALAAYDIAGRGRVHPLFPAAAGLVIATELASLWLYFQPWWPAAARRLLGV